MFLASSLQAGKLTPADVSKKLAWAPAAAELDNVAALLQCSAKVRPTFMMEVVSSPAGQGLLKPYGCCFVLVKPVVLADDGGGSVE